MKYAISGGEVEIDKQDLSLVAKFKWHLSSTGYAVWRGNMAGRKVTIRMHRLITDCPQGLVVDHINHDRLDNRRKNLRIVTQQENMRNRRDPGKGYWYQKPSGRWVVDFNSSYVGIFDSEAEARAVVALVRSGGTYVKPARAHCKHGHDLADAYVYGKVRRCKVCQSRRSREYFKRSYKAHPRPDVTRCPRGHDKTITRTANGDCSSCVVIRDRERRVKNGRETKR